MFRIQIILVTGSERQSLGIFELVLIPAKGDFLAVPSSKKDSLEQRLVQIQEVIYPVYRPGQRPEKSLDAIIVVFPKTSNEG